MYFPKFLLKKLYFILFYEQRSLPIDKRFQKKSNPKWYDIKPWQIIDITEQINK